MSDEKKSKDVLEALTFALGQRAINRKSDQVVIAEFLEECGYSHEEAQASAADMVQRQNEVGPGVTYGHIHAEQLADLWKRAAQHGKRKLVLEITADALDSDDGSGHISVEVKEAQTWAEYEQAEAEARAKEVN